MAVDKSREDLVQDVSKIGRFAKYHSLRKSDLMKLLKQYNENGFIPDKFIKKQKVGHDCKRNSECTTASCVRDKCVSIGEKSVIKVKEPGNCTLNKNVTLNPHQKLVAEFMRDTKRKGLVIVHKVGSGKTITALVSAQCLLIKSPEARVVVLTPKAVVEQFRKELNKLKLSPNILDRIEVSSHQFWLNKFADGSESTKNTILIVDEAHKFKSPTGGKYTKLLSQAARKARKVLLLTATPIVNSGKELINYVSIINDKNISSEHTRLKKQFDNKNQLLIKDYSDYLKCNFSVYDKVTKENFPETRNHTIKLQMAAAYEKQYNSAEDQTIENTDVKALFFNKKSSKNPDLSKFYNGIRRASNNIAIESPKIRWSIDKIKAVTDDGGKVMLYSSFLEFGVQLIANKLDSKGIEYEIISGKNSKKINQSNVDRFNEKGTKGLKVLLITAAGSEGLDLKATSAIIILEPFWNMARITQVIGRGVRYKSHESLPVDKRYVDVFHLILEKGKKADGGSLKTLPSADTLLMNMAHGKMNHINQFEEAMKENSIENRKCS
jgi:superfamily II DNA or RNA helicase